MEPESNNYVKNMKHIRWIQDYLVRKADKHLLPKVENTNVDRSVSLIHATIKGSMKRVLKGEKILDPNTNTTSFLHAEFLNVEETWGLMMPALGLHLAASQTGTATDSSTPATALTDIRRGTSAHAAPVTLALLGNEKPPVLPPVSPSVLPSKESSPPVLGEWSGEVMDEQLQLPRQPCVHLLPGCGTSLTQDSSPADTSTFAYAEAVQAVQAVPVVQPASWHDAVREDEARPCGQPIKPDRVYEEEAGLSSQLELSGKTGPSSQARSDKRSKSFGTEIMDKEDEEDVVFPLLPWRPGGE
eukprot:gene1905-33319_t